jgi:hypothetical protein
VGRSVASRSNRVGAQRTERPLWTCPKCGVKLLTKNLWHSCGQATMDDWFARMGARARELYDRFEGLVANCGEYHVSPAKTRIAFLALVRFAGVTSVSDREMRCSFAMPYPLSSRRFVKVEEVVPGWWSHRLTITDPAQLDEEVQSWLRESYRLMGLRGRLVDGARPRPPETQTGSGLAAGRGADDSGGREVRDARRIRPARARRR